MTPRTPVIKYKFQCPVVHVDGYKTGHIYQYPDGTDFCYSNFTPRSTKHLNVSEDYDDRIVVFGMRGLVQHYLVNEWNDKFFNQPAEEVVPLYKRLMDEYLGKDSVGIEHIQALHDLGYLPVMIKALPEGIRVPVRVAHWTIQSTVKGFSWVTNYLETQLSAEHWSSPTNATIAFEFKRLFTKWAVQTGSPLEFVDYQGHDFSFRGISSVSSAIYSGAAHLTCFKGTDTVPAILYHEELYAGKNVGASVPATEHAVMCMGGKDGELGTINRLITQVYPSGIVSIVSDTWDFWNTISHIALLLGPEIMARDGKVVFRPDSGNPADIICGTARRLDHVDSMDAAINEADDMGYDIFVFGGKYYQYFETSEKDGWYEVEPTVEMKGAAQVLWEIFGGTETAKGFKVLDSHVGLIYGDSINLSNAEEILERLAGKGFASCNIVFGIGSYTYQYITRDSIGSAIKMTFGEVNGEPREIYKDPKTDSGVKKSAVGLIRIEWEEGEYVQYDRQTYEEEKRGLLRPIFINSKFIDNEDTTEVIRTRLNLQVR